MSEARKRKNRRLKQAKEEVSKRSFGRFQIPWFSHLKAQTEIERYKAEREKAFKDNETKNVGSKDDIAAKIEADTKVKIEAMNRSVASNKDVVIQSLLSLCCDIKPEVSPCSSPCSSSHFCPKVHKNYRAVPGA